MKKLYKKDEKGNLFYAECWPDVIHTGKVGHKGTTQNLYSDNFDSEEDFYKHFEKRFLPKGYAPFSDDGKYWLLVQYAMKSLKGNKRDIWLRDTVTDALNDELGWTGLGHVDGFDMGRTFKDPKKYVLNIFCIVVDEDKGILAIKKRLRENRLDYSRVKIASRLLTSQDNYQLKYALKGDEFFL